MTALMSNFDPLYAFSGLFVGILVGITGVGGGSLMTPLLILVFGVHPTTAVGTDLLYAAITKGVGTAIHGVSRSIDWRVVVRLGLGSLPVTVLTLFVLSEIDSRGTAASGLITTVLGVALFLTAAVLLFRKRILALYAKRSGQLTDAQASLLTIAMGAVVGLLVSISSVGAGAIGATGLVLLYPRMPMARIVGSDIAHAVPLTLIAGVGHWMMGSTDWQLLGSLLVGSVPGIIIGSYYCSRVPEAALRTILAVTLTVVACKLLL